MIDITNALAAFTGPSDEVLLAFQQLGQRGIEVFRAMATALQPVLESFGAWYVGLPPELQSAISSGKPLNRRRMMRAQKLRRYARMILDERRH